MKRALSPLFFAAAVGSLLNCGGGGRKESFSAAGDAMVMSGVTGIWMGSTPDGKTFTVTFCENLAADHTDGNACDTLHVVRGGGRGTTETTEEPTGCGGCDYSYSAFVSGTVEGDDLAETPVKGEFDLASGDANGLGLPYQFDAISDTRVEAQYGTTPAVALNGHMDQQGVIEIERFAYPPLAAGSNDAGLGSSDAGSANDASADSGAAPSDVDAAAQATGSQQINEPAFELHRIGDASCPSN